MKRYVKEYANDVTNSLLSAALCIEDSDISTKIKNSVAEINRIVDECEQGRMTSQEAVAAIVNIEQPF